VVRVGFESFLLWGMVDVFTYEGFAAFGFRGVERGGVVVADVAEDGEVRDGEA